jgi:hypothetical protein
MLFYKQNFLKFKKAQKHHFKKMMGIFGQKKTIKGKSILFYNLFDFFKEIVREQKRMIEKSIRELERERRGLENNEKKLMMDIKKAAKDSNKNMKAIQIMAKDLVRIRKNQTKFIGMVAQLRGISLQMTVKS